MSLKSQIYNFLGKKNYLKLTSSLFFMSYNLGWLKRYEVYKWHYYSKRLIRPGDVVIDLGANLGYYSKLFSKWVGKEGRVIAVEPVSLYRDLLQRNTSKCTNVSVIPYALGEENSKKRMGVPGLEGHRHGLTKIIEDENEATSSLYDVEMRTPQEAFGELGRLDYIKCDIEGYEEKVIPLLSDLISKHKPLLQIESGPPNRKAVFDTMFNLGYKAFQLEGNKLVPLLKPEENSIGDILFKPES